MSATLNNLCDITEFKKDKAKNNLLELARKRIKSSEHHIAMRISKTAYRLFPEKKILFLLMHKLCIYAVMKIKQ